MTSMNAAGSAVVPGDAATNPFYRKCGDGTLQAAFSVYWMWLAII